MKPAIIVHGGAWRIPENEHTAHKDGCRAAALAGFKVLTRGGTAIDAVETAAIVLEDDPTFDAGTGSHLNQAGVVQLDAGIMDGATLQIGAVAAVERIKNPISVARLLLSSKHNLFVGSGAVEWAKRSGISLVEPADLIVPREQKRYENHIGAELTGVVDDAFLHPDGTVGAVAIDQNGDLAAATSTGGTLFKPAGRVGDSPLPGCGFYADNQSAAVSSTGHGETIIRILLARTAADLAAKLVDQASGQQQLYSTPAEAAIRVLAERVDGRGGLITIDRLGRVGFAYNTPHMARTYLIEGMAEPVVAI